jgi:hypothetical protein
MHRFLESAGMSVTRRRFEMLAREEFEEWLRQVRDERESEFG